MADKERLKIDGKNLSDLRVIDLKKELEKRGMSKSGSKKDLHDRLKSQLQLEKLREEASESQGEDDAPSVQVGDKPSPFIQQYMMKREQLLKKSQEEKRRVQEEKLRRESESQTSASENEEGKSEMKSTEGALSPNGIDNKKAFTEEKSKPEKKPEDTEQATDNEASPVKISDKNDGTKVGTSPVEVKSKSSDKDSETALSGKIDSVKNKSNLDFEKEKQRDTKSSESGEKSDKKVSKITSSEKSEKEVKISSSRTETSFAKEKEKRDPTEKNLEEVKAKISKDKVRMSSAEIVKSSSQKQETEPINKMKDKQSIEKSVSDDKELKTASNAKTKDETSKQVSGDSSVNREDKPNKPTDDEQKKMNESADSKKRLRLRRSRSGSESSSESSSDDEDSPKKSRKTKRRSSSASSRSSYYSSRSSGSSSGSEDESPKKVKGVVQRTAIQRNRVKQNSHNETAEESFHTATEDVSMNDDEGETADATGKRQKVEDTKEDNKSKNEDTAVTAENKAPRPPRKRKWGSTRTNKKASINVSTQLLKESGIITDISSEILKSPEPVLELGVKEDVDTPEESEEDTKKIKRTVTQEVNEDQRMVVAGSNEEADISGNESEEESEKPSAIDKKKESDTEGEEEENKENKSQAVKEPTIIRRLGKQPSLPADEPEKVKREASPSRRPQSNIIHIYNLVRPFTVGQLKMVLSKTGPLKEGGFWIDKIKSNCVAAFENEEDAIAARTALHGTRWPSSNPKILRVDFTTQRDLDHYLEKDKPPPKAADLPEPASKRRPQEQADRTRSPQKLREWDRDKMRQSRSRSNERQARRRSSADRRSRERKERREQREKSRERKKKEKKPAEDEVPAKLLDDLFRKTKTTPCIYWLPLTDEQYQERQNEIKRQREIREEQRRQRDKENAEQRLQRQKEREQRIKERERQRGSRQDDRSRNEPRRRGRSDSRGNSPDRRRGR